MVDWTYATLAAILGVFLVTWGLGLLKVVGLKGPKFKYGHGVTVGVGVLVLAMSFGWFGMGLGWLGVDASQPLTTAGDDGGALAPGDCELSLDSGVKTTFGFPELYTNALRTDTFAYKINGQNEITTAAAVGTAVYFSPGDVVTVFSNTNGSGDVYSDVFTYTTPCKQVDTTSFYVKPYTTAMLTATIINSDGVTKNSATAADDLTAGDAKNMRMSLANKYQKYYGSEHMLICAVFNNTGQYNDVNPNSGNLIGQPGSLSVAAGNRAKCYEYPALKSSESKDIVWTVDTDDVKFHIDGGNVTFSFLGDEAFRDMRTVPPSYTVGYEDKDGVQQGPATETVIYAVM